jgi:hypothetical protein
MRRWDDESALDYLRKIAVAWDEAPGESEEEEHAERFLRSAAVRLGFDEDEIVTWVQLGAGRTDALKRRAMWRGVMLTLGEVRALKPGDRVWFNYQKYAEEPNRINEAGEVRELHTGSIDIELATGELYDFDLSQHASTADDAPARCECSPGVTTLYDVETAP